MLAICFIKKVVALFILQGLRYDIFNCRITLNNKYIVGFALFLCFFVVFLFFLIFFTFLIFCLGGI